MYQGEGTLTRVSPLEPFCLWSLAIKIKSVATVFIKSLSWVPQQNHLYQRQAFAAAAAERGVAHERSWYLTINGRIFLTRRHLKRADR